MKKYPVVYTYKSSHDHGEELKYSLRSLNNIYNWDGSVFVVGDKEDWFSDNIIHINHNSQSNAYADVADKILLACRSHDIPSDFIYMMDDVYVTEPVEFSNIHRGFIEDYNRESIHTNYVRATRDFLEEKLKIEKPLNYEVHAPFFINKEKWLQVYNPIALSIKSSTPYQWKSVYGNLFMIGGKLFEDKKTYDTHLLSGTYISTNYFTHELKDLFPKPSKFEKEVKKIAIISHFSPLKMTTGMIKLVNYIAEFLSTEYKVDVIATRENFPSSIKLGNIGYYLGKNKLNNLDEYDLVIAHPPMNIIDHENLVLLYDSDKDVDTPNAPQYIDHKLNIFTTKHIRKSYNQDGLILHPIVYPEDHKTDRGDKITLIGASDYKGINVLKEIANLMPEKEFLVIKSGWQKEAQVVPNIPNIQSMKEVSDMKDIWSKTHILISPSKGEQYGMASLEAMASGIPVIAYKCPGVEEAIGGAAKLMENFDPKDWVNAILEVEESYDQYVEKSEQQSKIVDSKKELDNLMKEIKKLC